MYQNFIQRTIFKEIWQEIDTHHIILLNGARQVGKTTLLKLIMEELKSKKQIKENCLHYIDLEDTNQLLIWDNQQSVLKILPRDNQKHYYFIDEFQNAKTIGKTLKLIHDHHKNIKLIITGSASWYLNINESLAGRKIVVPIWPFSFKEFLKAVLPQKEWLNLYQQNEAINNNTIKLFNPYLLDFISFGGYPEIVLAETNEEKIKKLSGLINAYLLKDIRLWNYSANTLELKKLLSLLASQIGSLLSVSGLANNANLGIPIISNRLDLFQNTFILHLLSPFFTNKQKEIVKSPKTFLIDTGLRNNLLNIFSVISKTPDFGSLSENFAITELLKKQTVFETMRFWRTKDGKEVDIILKRKTELIPIEVKGGNQTTIPTGLKAFIRAYKPKKTYVLNWSIIKDEEYQNCQVHFRPIWFAGLI